MKVGIKFGKYEEFKWAQKFIDLVDFMEIFALEGEDYSYLKDVNIPFIIHNEHEDFGVNLANPEKLEKNKSSLDFSIKLANQINAKSIILHSGLKENNSCSEKNILKFLEKYPDGRILIESLPPYNLGNEDNFGYDYKTLKNLLNKTNKGFCMDLSHSSQAAFRLNKNPVEFIKELLSLNPVHFHLSDTILESHKDMHNHLGEGNLPLGEFKNILPDSSWITLEVPKTDKIKEDIKFLK